MFINASIINLIITVLFAFAVCASPAYAIEVFNKELAKFEAHKEGLEAGSQIADFFAPKQATKEQISSQYQLQLTKLSAITYVATLPEGKNVFLKQSKHLNTKPQHSFDLEKANETNSTPYIKLAETKDSGNTWLVEFTNFVSYTRDRPALM